MSASSHYSTSQLDCSDTSLLSTLQQPIQQDIARCTLHDVLTNSKSLYSFEHYLRETLSHENLMFIEAMNQLKNEKDTKLIEMHLHRIYKTFIACGALYELNITTQTKVKRRMDAMQWAIITQEEAVSILSETEEQVLDILNNKLPDYLLTDEGFTSGHSSIASTFNKLQKRVVIIGGGFTGFTVASILDPMPLFHVTLIDTKDSFEYTPSIIKKMMNPSQIESLRIRHDSYILNGKMILGHVSEICQDATSLLVNGDKISFDYLIIATGSSYSSQLKSTDTSSLYRLSGLEEESHELQKAQRVLIIGGGLVGCELASEIAGFEFPGSYPKKYVTIVESHSSVIYRSDTHQQEQAQKYLEDLGVEVILNERIIDYDTSSHTTYRSTNGRIFHGYQKVFMATGAQPNSSLFVNSAEELGLENCVDRWGRIRVKPTLQIDHNAYPHIFAGGDVTNVVEEKTGYAATIAGVCIARNICRLVKGKSPLKQGTKGTLSAPSKPLHGMKAHGGIGKQNLNRLKKKFAFLNLSWAALKYFNETQFMNIVQGQSGISSHTLGKLPRRLALPSDALDSPTSPATPTAFSLFSPSLYYANHQAKTPHSPTQENRHTPSFDSDSHKSSSLCSSYEEEDSNESLNDSLVEHFTFGGESIKILSKDRPCSQKTPSIPPSKNAKISPRRSSTEEVPFVESYPTTPIVLSSSVSSCLDHT
ncbi:hypothetical protein BDF14DRAFT_1778675 [Spinellus fusiger]|nr:hypothetical protein BDF14DRAFT_1778675 [Spinellus fusiger]